MSTELTDRYYRVPSYIHAVMRRDPIVNAGMMAYIDGRIGLETAMEAIIVALVEDRELLCSRLEHELSSRPPLTLKFGGTP